jgi:hypothetical protein
VASWFFLEVSHWIVFYDRSETSILKKKHRVGVGRFTVPTSEDDSTPRVVIQHLFDGLGLLHKFRMVDGRVYYMSRYTHNGIVRRAMKDGYVTNSWMGPNPNTPLFEAQDPCSKLLGARVSGILEIMIGTIVA